MSKKESLLDNISLHPFFIGIYPILSLYYLNITEVELSAITKAMITSLILTAMVSIFFLIIFRSWEGASLSIAYSLLLLLTYGHVFNLLSDQKISETLIGRHRYILPLWGIIYLSGMYYLNKITRSKTLTRSLNTVSILLVAFTLAQVGFFLLQTKIVQSRTQEAQAVSQNLHSDIIQRDVYYILVDAYSREDLLREKLGLDTSEFTNALKDMGFYIPKCTQSNYSFTNASLASSLNMDYLDTLGIEIGVNDKTAFTPFIHNNVTRKSFEELGYQTVTFKNQHPSIDIQDSTYYFDYFKDASSLSQSNSINFQYLFLNTTAFLPIREYLETQKNFTLPAFLGTWIPIGNTLNSREYRQYQQNLYALQMLEKIPELPGSKFVYAHLFITHQPYVFYPDGRFHSALAQDADAYRDQVVFANTRLLEVIKAILEKSAEEPIIIIQGDHSFFPDSDTVKILNAYHLPGDAEKNLYDTITPVNTFRFIFNTFYNADYQILPDISRYVDKDNNLVTTPPTCSN